MSSAQRRNALKKRIAAGEYVPKAPVGKLRLLHRTPQRTQEYMLADLTRGKRKAAKIHNVAVSD